MSHMSPLASILTAAMVPSADDGKAPEPVPYTRIFTDKSGDSHFSDEIIKLVEHDYAPPAPPLAVSKPEPATEVRWIAAPPTWSAPPHPAPARQFIFVLAGEIEVTVTSGEARRFRPGSILLLDDTTGKGHASRVIGSERTVQAAVPIRTKESGPATRGRR